MNFSNLVQSIQQTHNALQQQAAQAINRALTIRNWLIGFYIVEFEQKGEDRAEYGEKLMRSLSKKLKEAGLEGLSFTNLNLFRQFYLIYPQIVQTASEFLPVGIVQTLSEQSISIRQTMPAKSKTRQTLSDESTIHVPPDKIINRLSFSHIAELLQIDDPLKRAFYEIECMKGTWSVRELRRQINSLHYERSGISKKPEKLSAMIAEKVEILQPADIIKSVYTFEFFDRRL